MNCPRVLAVALTLLLSGCTTLGPSEEVIKSLATSERSWCVTVTSVYGVLKMGGTGVSGGTMSCTNDGLSVKSEAATIGVPIVVTPSVSVGQPVMGPR